MSRMSPAGGSAPAGAIGASSTRVVSTTRGHRSSRIALTPPILFPSEVFFATYAGGVPAVPSGTRALGSAAPRGQQPLQITRIDRQHGHHGHHDGDPDQEGG